MYNKIKLKDLEDILMKILLRIKFICYVLYYYFYTNLHLMINLTLTIIIITVTPNILLKIVAPIPILLIFNFVIFPIKKYGTHLQLIKSGKTYELTMCGKIKDLSKEEIQHHFLNSLEEVIDNPSIFQLKSKIRVHTHGLFATKLFEALYKAHNIDYNSKLWREGTANGFFELEQFKIEIYKKKGKNIMIAGNYGYSVILKDEKLIQALKHIERSIDYYDIILPPDVFRVTKNT